MLDTVVLFAASDPLDKHHEDAVAHLSSAVDDLVIAGSAMFEFDLVLKSNGFSPSQRRTVFLSMAAEFPSSIQAVGSVTAPILFTAAILQEVHGLDYFDALVAAEALARDGKVVSTDREFDKIRGLERLPLKADRARG
ncbi:MAG: PIN domain-containing protein [Nitrososphaerales archaeon]|nr:PIN domain-containing protein [Nitrososphaerales archaeon]